MGYVRRQRRPFYAKGCSQSGAWDPPSADNSDFDILTEKITFAPVAKQIRGDEFGGGKVLAMQGQHSVGPLALNSCEDSHL